jgi:hypothetical protein
VDALIVGIVDSLQAFGAQVDLQVQL